jgi:hypothetical protein
MQIFGYLGEKSNILESCKYLESDGSKCKYNQDFQSKYCTKHTVLVLRKIEKANDRDGFVNFDTGV